METLLNNAFNLYLPVHENVQLVTNPSVPGKHGGLYLNKRWEVSLLNGDRARVRNVLERHQVMIPPNDLPKQNNAVPSESVPHRIDAEDVLKIIERFFG